METLESLLREKFEQPVDIDSGWVGGLIANTGRLHRRRTLRQAALTTLAAAVAAVVAAVGLSGLGGGAPHSVEPAGPIFPIPASIDPNLMTSIDIDNLTLTGALSDLELADGVHGFGRFLICPGGRLGIACSEQFRATSDGGRTFTVRTAPPGWSSDSDAKLFVFDADHVLLEPKATLIAGDRPPATNPSGWVSTDGARTWHKIVQAPIDTADRVPAGDQLTWADPGPTSGTSRLLAIGSDGRLTDISSTPVDAVPWMRAPIDGTLLADSPSGFFTSRDDGHTWQQSTIPEDLSQVEFDPIGTDGSRIYGLVDYGTPDARGGDRQEILVSDDHGVTWQNVPLPALTPLIAPSPSPDGNLTAVDQVSAAATASGGLVINDLARTWRLAPGASAFVADDQAFPITNVSSVGGLMFAVSLDVRDAHATLAHYQSADGVHWDAVAF